MQDSGSGFVGDFYSCSSGHGLFLLNALLPRSRFVTDVSVLCVLFSLSFPFLSERVFVLCVRDDGVLIPSPRNLLGSLTGPALIFCERNHARVIYKKEVRTDNSMMTATYNARTSAFGEGGQMLNVEFSLCALRLRKKHASTHTHPKKKKTEPRVPFQILAAAAPIATSTLVRSLSRLAIEIHARRSRSR